MSDRATRVLVATLLVIFFAALASAVYVRAATDPYETLEHVIEHVPTDYSRDFSRAN